MGRYDETVADVFRNEADRCEGTNEWDVPAAGKL